MEEKYGMSFIKPFVEKLIKFKECGTIVSLPEAGLNRLMLSVFESLEKSEFFEVLDLALLTKDDIFAEVTEKLEALLENDVEFVLIKNLATKNELAKQYLMALNVIRNQHGKKFNYIFHLFEDPKWVVSDLDVGNFLDLLLANITFFPYASGKEFQIIISQCETRFEVKIDKESAQKIESLSGGCPYLIKNLVKKIAEGGALELSDEITEWGRYMLKQYKLSELNKIRNWETLDIERKEFYQKMGLIDESGKFRSQILEKFLKEKNLEGEALVLESGKLLVDGNDIGERLTQAEKEVLIVLLNEKRIARDRVAEVYYGKSRAEEISDYSIDKVMSVLRQKLVVLGVSRDYIKTQKGYGWSI